MKKIIALIILFASVAALVPVSAQKVSVNIKINVDRQPAWGPVGYDYVSFYYFPDINVYYDVNNRIFHYTSGNRWVYATYLPAKYRRYDLYSMYKVVLNSDYRPWDNNKVHRKQYAHYRNDRTQVVIRHTTDKKYQKSRNNHLAWVDAERNSNSSNKKKNEVSTTRTNRSQKTQATTSTRNNRSSR